MPASTSDEHTKIARIFFAQHHGHHPLFKLIGTQEAPIKLQVSSLKRPDSSALSDSRGDDG